MRKRNSITVIGTIKNIEVSKCLKYNVNHMLYDNILKREKKRGI